VELDGECRRELETAATVRSAKRLLERRIERQIPAAGLFVDDRPNLPRPGVFGKLAADPADFGRKTHPHGPMPFLGHSHSRTNVTADVLPSIALARGGEDVKTRLEPVGESTRDLQRLVKCVAVRLNSG